MAGITGLGTTFNEPNYHGELIALTPTDTPLLSLSGGINGGGGQIADTILEWQTYDLRDPAARPRLEGADAPTAEARVRANVTNRTQIFQEKVSTSYTKQAAVERYAGTNTGSSGPNPVRDEHAWQIMQELKTMARDVNHVFWHSKRHDPADNTTARQTAGLLSVITTNKTMNGEITGITSATDTFTKTAHGLSDGDKVVFTELDAITALRPDRVYYVVSSAANTFKVSATSGGSAITVGTASDVELVEAATAFSVDDLGEFMQGVWDNGGISESETTTLFVPSRQKRAITAAYAAAHRKVDPLAGTRNVAGQSVDTIETDFGVLNLVLERALPPDALVLVNLSDVMPVFTSIPGKGVLFEEELAKTGASDNTQIYGEIGLKYGNERTHGVIRGLAV